MHFANFFSGDPYVGPRDKEIKDKKNQIEELEREVKRLKAKVAQLESRHVFIHAFQKKRTMFLLHRSYNKPSFGGAQGGPIPAQEKRKR